MNIQFTSILSVLCGSTALIGCGGADASAPLNRNENVSVVSAQLASVGTACKALASNRALAPEAKFAVPKPSPGAVQQVIDLAKARDFKAALQVAALERTPQASWLTGGTPEEVRNEVHKTMIAAAFERRVPILVAYNLPYRDCSQYSAGGASDTEAYKAWIDGFAAGIGPGQAVVILEPDGLGIIPNNTNIFGNADWCQPTVTDSNGVRVPMPGANPTERYAQLNYAVDSIESKAQRASVYLDATNSAWQAPGESAYRLTMAGVQRAQGFFLNVSNFQLTSELVQYGTWVSASIAAPSGAPAWAFDANGNFHFDWLPSQYDPALNYKVNYGADYVASTTASFQDFMGSAVASTHFVIDTGRNGQGPLKFETYAAAPYNQPGSVIAGLNAGNWCNPPGAGAGLRPTATTGVALLDAYLWIKTPGGSDGSCDIAGGARAWDFSLYNPWALSTDAMNHFDPLWGTVDPDAGAWFPAQALQLAQLANPPLF